MHHAPHTTRHSGFSLIELMVTVAIFALMTGLILARYNSFNSGTLLTNLAYDTALAIRQAQAYGLSVRTTNATTPTFSSAYGVNFDDSTAANAAKFVLFADFNNTHAYESAVDSIESTYNIKQGAKISSICVGNGTICNVGTRTSVDIVFQRPDPTAIIVSGGGIYTYAEITLTSGDGTGTKIVTVNQTGQVTVK